MLGAAAVGAVALVLLPAAPASANEGHPRVLIVHPGESIQAAINAAKPGHTVLLRRGTYQEKLTITTDRLTLLGAGARLEAPATPMPGGCVPAGVANTVGICVAGRTDPTTGAVIPVRDVTIRGLTIARFPSTGIIVLRGKDARVENVDATGGRDYGVLFIQSTGSTIEHSTLHGGNVAGLYIGDSPQARATVRNNRFFDNGVFGIFVRTASHGTVTGNKIEGSCMGIGLIPTSTAEDSVSDWRIKSNRIRGKNRQCSTGAGPVTGIGIYLGGTKNVTVEQNRIENNVGAPNANPAFGGGVVLNNGSLFGFPNQPIGNRVVRNTVRGNLPYDLTVVVPGTGNSFVDNRCVTSSPAGLC